MTAFGTVGGGITPTTAAAEAADAESLTSLVNAAIADIDGSLNVITAITLAGAGDGHTFMVLIESAPVGSVTGGLPGFIGGDAGTIVRCWLGADEESLLVAKTAAGVPPPGGGIAPYAFADEQLAGAAKGQRFMGLTVFVASSFPLGVVRPYARALVTQTQALGAGSTILAFDGLGGANQFTLPAPQTLHYTGGVALLALVEASVTVGLTADGDFTVDIVTDPLGAPVVVATMKGHVAAGEFDNTTVLGVVVLEPEAITPSNLGIRITSAAGSVLYATLRVSPLG